MAITPDLSKPLVFEYFDGASKRYGDAAKLLQAITYGPSDVPLFNPTFWARVEAREQQASLAAAATITTVFGLVTWDDRTGSGLTEDQVIRVFLDFTLFLADEKKNPFGSSIWPVALWEQVFPRESTPAAAGCGEKSTANESPAANGCHSSNASADYSAESPRSHGIVTPTEPPTAPPATTLPEPKSPPQFQPLAI